MFNKKPTRPARKLTLTRETLKRLTENLGENQLREVAGGRSGGCSDVDLCGYTISQYQGAC
jgi:hypothetical protein